MKYKNPNDLLVSELEKNGWENGDKQTTMRERFDDTFYEEVNSFMGTAFGDSELDTKLKHFIEQEVEKEREGIVEMIDKMKWRGIECRGNEFEADLQNEAYDNIINNIKNRT